VIHELEGNRRLRDDFGGFAHGPEWTESSITLAGAKNLKDPTITASGLSSFKPGPRLTWAVLDDTTDPSHVTSRRQRDKQMEALDERLVPMMTQDGVIVGIHTTYHNDDLPNRLSRRKEWRSVRYPLVVDEARRTVSWSEHWPWERVEQAMRRPLVFSRQYQLRESSPEDRLLPPPEFYDERLLEFRGGVWRVAGESCQMVTGVDPAMTSRDVSEGSQTAIVTAAVTTDRTKYVVEVRAGRWGPEKVMEEVEQAWKRWRAVQVFVEEVSFGRVYGDLLRRRGVPAIGSQAKGDKIQRIIGTLNPEMAAHRVKLLEEGMEGLVREIEDFPGETLDCVDALEHLVRNAATSRVYATGGDRLIRNVREHVRSGNGRGIVSDWGD
jgi:predicted phage terminase large subunit-like protein